MNKKTFIKRLKENNPIHQIPLIETIKEYNFNIDKVYNAFLDFQLLKEKMTLIDYCKTFSDAPHTENVEGCEYVLNYGGLHILYTPNRLTDDYPKHNYELTLMRDEYWSDDLEYLELVLFFDWAIFEGLNFDYTKLTNYYDENDIRQNPNAYK